MGGPPDWHLTPTGPGLLGPCEVGLEERIVQPKPKPGAYCFEITGPPFLSRWTSVQGCLCPFASNLVPCILSPQPHPRAAPA